MPRGQDLANFMRATLKRDPFSTGGQKVPWMDLREGLALLVLC